MKGIARNPDCWKSLIRCTGEIYLSVEEVESLAESGISYLSDPHMCTITLWPKNAYSDRCEIFNLIEMLLHADPEAEEVYFNLGAKEVMLEVRNVILIIIKNMKI